MTFFSEAENGPVQFITYQHPGLVLVIPPLVHSCSFPGSILIPAQGPHVTRQITQTFLPSHLIQLRCQDLALKLAKYVSLRCIHDGFFLFLCSEIKCLWSPMVTLDMNSVLLLENRKA